MEKVIQLDEHHSKSRTGIPFDRNPHPEAARVISHHEKNAYARQKAITVDATARNAPPQPVEELHRHKRHSAPDLRTVVSTFMQVTQTTSRGALLALTERLTENQRDQYA